MNKYKIGFFIIIGMIICLLFITIPLLSAQAWGNQAWFDFTFSFERAVICLPDPAAGLCENFYVEGKVDSWQDYENSDVVQVTIDGVTYLTHYSNVVLISE